MKTKILKLAARIYVRRLKAMSQVGSERWCPGWFRFWVFAEIVRNTQMRMPE